MIRDFSIQTRTILQSIPPIGVGTLLPILTLLVVWITLRDLGMADDLSFVVSCVSAQAVLLWRNLPRAALSLRGVDSNRPHLVVVPVVALIALAGLQLWLANPLVTQRLLSFYCLLFFVMMLRGMRRENEMLNRVAPVVGVGEKYTAPVSLLRINAIIALVMLTLNEVLIALETPLIWITVMPLALLAAHTLYWSLVLIVLPSDEDAAD